MSSGASTPARRIAPEPGDFVVRTPVESGTIGVESTASATQSAGRRLSRFMLPLAATAVAFGVPAPPAVRRVFSCAGVSRSEIGGTAWFLDEFIYSEEPATVDQIRALNALLALPAVEGYSIDFPD